MVRCEIQSTTDGDLTAHRGGSRCARQRCSAVVKLNFFLASRLAITQIPAKRSLHFAFTARGEFAINADQQTLLACASRCVKQAICKPRFKLRNTSSHLPSANISGPRQSFLCRRIIGSSIVRFRKSPAAVSSFGGPISSTAALARSLH